MEQPKVVDPIAWIRQWCTENAVGNWKHPVVYVAHPVAARPGETLATCSRCKAEYTFAGAEQIDLCEHDEPVRHTEDKAAIVAFNLRRAMRWWRWLHLGIPEAVFLMPWYVNVSANGEADPALIERGLRDDCACVMRCDTILNCGPRISSGMGIESNAARDVDNPVFQVPGFRGEPHAAKAARETMWHVVPAATA